MRRESKTMEVKAKEKDNHFVVNLADLPLMEDAGFTLNDRVKEKTRKQSEIQSAKKEEKEEKEKIKKVMDGIKEEEENRKRVEQQYKEFLKLSSKQRGNEDDNLTTVFGEEPEGSLTSKLSNIPQQNDKSRRSTKQFPETKNSNEISKKQNTRRKTQTDDKLQGWETDVKTSQKDQQKRKSFQPGMSKSSGMTDEKRMSKGMTDEKRKSKVAEIISVITFLILTKAPNLDTYNVYITN